MPKTILLVDDDREISELLTKYLREQGFDVISTLTPAEGLKAIRTRKPDLVILDVMMPDKTGFEVCKEIRKDNRIPIIMLTARAHVTDKVVGLELGADDYVSKPFEPRELVSRINSVLRRTEGQPPADSQLDFGDLAIDVRKRSVRAMGKPAEVSSAEFDVLLFLARHPGEVISRDRLLEHLRGSDCEAFNRSIDTLVSRLRVKLHDNPHKPKFIKTVWGNGYVFIAGETPKKSASG